LCGWRTGLCGWLRGTRCHLGLARRSRGRRGSRRDGRTRCLWRHRTRRKRSRVDLLAQLTRRSRTNDAMLSRSDGRRVLGVRWLRRCRCLGNRRGRNDRLRNHLCGSGDSHRLGRGRCRCYLGLGSSRHRLRCRRLGSGLLRGTLRRRRRLLGLYRPNQAVTLGLAANPVRLCFFDRRGVALHADAELDTEIECLFVGEA
jgi:hypothetical protein